MNLITINYLEFFAILALFISHGIYIYAIYKKEATPHIFSWLNWSILVLIAALAQFNVGGGYSALVLALDAVICLVITALAVFIGEKNITKSDWVAFIGTSTAIPVWLITKDPVSALIIIICIDTASFFPTVRKSWNKPYSEPTWSYLWSGLGYFLTIFTIIDINISNLIYPVFLVATDWGLVLYLIIRRKFVAKK